VGLIQRAIEEKGIPTIGISLVRDYTERVKPPRTVFLKWPFGHPLGEPFHVEQQRSVLTAAFRALQEIQTPGTIVDLPLRWRGETYQGKHVFPSFDPPSKAKPRV
jgi:D-proline reductase (dithiol) PrdB